MMLREFMAQKPLEIIIESIDEAIHIVDQDGVTMYYNSIAAKLDGLSQEEVIGKHLLTNFPSLTSESSTLLQVLSTKKAIFKRPQNYYNHYGQLIETINTTIPLLYKGELLGAIEIAKDIKHIKQLSEKLLELENLHRTMTSPRQKQNSNKNTLYQWHDIITEDPVMIEQIEIAQKAARTTYPIMVYGETGTGKELMVQAIHSESNRQAGPFVVQNCASLPGSLLESLLFGTKKGSFTGAVDRKGLFELADKGSLFLDEIQSMPLDFQAKILRTIEDGYIRRVGGTESYQIDVRVIVAMNKHPLECLEQGVLREDLYYRLSFFLLELPPLKKRQADIARLIRHFCTLNAKTEVQLEDSVQQFFEKYTWPGNIRELKHVIEYAITLCSDRIIMPQHLPLHLQKKYEQLLSSNTRFAKRIGLKEQLEEDERHYIKEALERTKGNVKKAAELLDIPRQTLQYKIKKFKVKGKRDGE
ncbi:ATPase AAA [Alkalihalobacillus pseudalcaliphilus]|nr:ATPase AAA [Alkalihalobacillus pseudalcaliphilus]